MWGDDDDAPPLLPPPDPQVWWDEPAPIGQLLGPDGAVMTVVFPEREPLGFVRRQP